ncbi:uncharacterized protein LOC129594755 [Paramacrobiotus metropolitanus]|uniref:uncharacterized protein LOC129594755 n=1 Tax=Paramacrobiotus metropolitanus TaxID=2943436 RepID=UPI002445EA5B|nr:uncharacterized protein LOC129594755 [Paramacrobiotus metropolitanus]XP_055347519.1 uncharacterized protein LOC129594755 [Paramacrobiotus metropolitanus]XP_055347520.1 uncharacterized protein LOC129594755 [Paramacrobiotus metropolitanus]
MSWPSSRAPIPYLDFRTNSCIDPAARLSTAHPFSIFPRITGQGTEYDCILPIGLLYHCPEVSTGSQCIQSYSRDGAAMVDPMSGLPNRSISVEDWVATAAYVVEVVSPTLLALGLVSNLLVLSILCCRNLRSGVNSFLLSSTLGQILYILAVFLLRMIDYSEEYKRHEFHVQGRSYIHHFSYFFYLIVLWQILAAGIERVVVGFTPDSGKRRCSPWRADLVNVFIWMAAFGLVFPVLWYSKLQYVLGYAAPHTTGSGSASALACSILYWFQLVFSIFIPYPSLLILFFLLISSLHKQSKSVKKITLGSNGEMWRQNMDEEMQLTRLVLVQVLLFFLLTGAYAIGQLVLTLNLAADRTTCMWSILIDLFHLGPLLYSSLQFILYGCIVEKFAVTFRNVCCRCCGKYDQ